MNGGTWQECTKGDQGMFQARESEPGKVLDMGNRGLENEYTFLMS